LVCISFYKFTINIVTNAIIEIFILKNAMITTKKDLMELFHENSPKIEKQHTDKDPDDIKVLDYGDPHKTSPGEGDKPMPKGTGFAKESEFTNETIASLIDEICNVQTGYGVIDDVNFVNEVLYEGKLDELVLENIINEALYEYYSMTENLTEAEYKGRKVSLGKIMRGDVKKYKVHVKNDKGNVVKVNFGDPNMEIKRDNPRRRKNFRARHRCDNPGPRW
jgi:hypothetical protein